MSCTTSSISSFYCVAGVQCSDKLLWALKQKSQTILGRYTKNIREFWLGMGFKRIKENNFEHFKVIIFSAKKKRKKRITK